MNDSCDSIGFAASVGQFQCADVSAVIGRLCEAVAASGFTQQRTAQIETWQTQIDILQRAAQTLIERTPEAANWHILLEYEIPRRQKRPDVVLLAEDVIFVIEFKVGATRFHAADRWQAESYALDLRDFHAASEGRTIIPVLCATEAAQANGLLASDGSLVWPVVDVDADSLADRLHELFLQVHNSRQLPIEPERWVASAYRPTLTIVEAAERLFDGHDVREIAHSYADNLTATTARLVTAIEQAQQHKERFICFVTGVPGAGKTLTGLNAVHDPLLRGGGRPPGIFLSGNGPLVKIVREALVQSCQRRGARRQDATHEVSTFIQNVHTFLRHYRERPHDLPPEHVVVFDEAQRAWNARQMLRKQKVEASEPQLMLEVMCRCTDWSVVVALVGGGQEIHLGEAGLSEWGRALAEQREPWTVLVSPEALEGGESVASHRLFDDGVPAHLNVQPEPTLHLSVSVRSLRAQRLAEWVNDVLMLRPERAAQRLSEVRDFPVVLTRDLRMARQWLRDRSGLEPMQRCGLVASSGALRHRAYGLELSGGFRQNYPYEHWFLGSPNDIRSSFTLEVAATEFECQGLELDWVGLCWGDDLCLGPDGDWTFRRFNGTRWQRVRRDNEQQYLLNKYRVLLTRARQGLVIWVPCGDSADPTRDPEQLDRVYAYLTRAGAQMMQAM